MLCGCRMEGSALQHLQHQRDASAVPLSAFPTRAAAQGLPVPFGTLRGTTVLAPIWPLSHHYTVMVLEWVMLKGGVGWECGHRAFFGCTHGLETPGDAQRALTRWKRHQVCLGGVTSSAAGPPLC